MDEQDGKTALRGRALSNDTHAYAHGKKQSELLLEMDGSRPVLKSVNYPSISVIIPARNEAKNLPHVLPQIPTIVDEVILVDGCSTDDTIEVAQGLMEGIKIIKQAGRGKGQALQCGIAASTGNIIVMMDADGSNDPEELHRFVETLLAGADYAKGSRFLGRGGSTDLTFLRKLGNFGLSTVVNILFRIRFTDLCYGYNAFWKDCLEFLEVDCDGFEIETLMSLRACKAKLRIVEVPSFEHSRIYGRSNLRVLRDGWRVLKVIVKEWMNGRSVFGTVSVDQSFQRERFAYKDRAMIEPGDAIQ